MGEGTDRISQYDDPAGVDDVAAGADTTTIDDIEQTRAELSETIDAIQERLAPERLSGEAREVAADVGQEVRSAVDEAIDRIREAFPELSGQAEQAARDVIDHALQEAKTSLPVLGEQAQETIDHVVDHAIAQAREALRELGAQARASMRDATIGKVERMADTTSQTTKSFSSSLVTTIRQNPGPAALTALGIGWLMMSGTGKGAQATGYAASGATPSAQGTGDGLKDAASAMTGQVHDAVSTAKDDALHTASQAADGVQETAAGVAGQVQQTASATVGHVQETAGQVTTQAQLLPTRVKLAATDNPVPLGLVAMALGGAVALLAPETRREQQVLGGARDRVLEQAQSRAVDVVEKVTAVAEEAGEAVEKEAKYQGLTTEQA